jgi:hypothetical protein
MGWADCVDAKGVAISVTAAAQRARTRTSFLIRKCSPGCFCFESISLRFQQIERKKWLPDGSI